MQNIPTPIFLLSLLSFSSLLHAQDETPETTLSPITVTATRTDHETKLVSSTVIKRADIERLQSNSVEEVLRGIAGVDIRNGSDQGTSVFLRGTNSNHIVVLIDGVRVGSAIDGRTAFEDLPINEIDNIEVIRGAKSSLYGSDAIGGVIHIHTRQGAGKTFQPILTASAGSHDRYRYSAGVSGKIDNSWYNANFTHDQTHGFNSCDGTGGFSYGCGTNEPDKDGYSNYSGSARVGHQFSDTLLLEAHLLYATGNNQYDGSYQNKTAFVQQVIGGQAKYKATDFWTMTFKAGQSRDRSHSYENGVLAAANNTERFSLSAQNDFTLAKEHLVSVGYDYLADQFKTSNGFTQSKRDDHAVYGQYQGEYENHQLLAGFRHGQNQQFGSYNTWNIAYGYQFLEAFNFSASYSTAFKAPSFSDVYAPAFWGSNPDLKPEKSDSYEVSLKGKHEWGNWAINHYTNYINNLIAPDMNWNLINVSKAQIQGLEFMGETQVLGFNVRGNLSLLKPEDKSTGKLLARRAEEVFRLDVDKKIADFSVGATVIAQGRSFSSQNEANQVAGFATLDLRAEYSLLKQVTLQAKVNNILNKQYQTVKGYNTDDLNVFFTLRYTPDI